jgi:hypothetical protein
MFETTGMVSVLSPVEAMLAFSRNIASLVALQQNRIVEFTPPALVISTKAVSQFLSLCHRICRHSNPED